MNGKKESILLGYPKFICFECSKNINEQMERNICKVKIGKEQATGFFCKIPFPDKDHMLSVLIMSNHLHKDTKLSNQEISMYIESEKEIKKLNRSGRKFYTDKEYDVTIIELKEADNITNYLELDDIIINDIIKDENKIIKYIDETIYIIQYPEGKLSVSYGVLNQIYEDKKYNFNHKCCTTGGSSGSPILNTKNKIIGIHKEGNNNFNIGTFLNYPIKDFIRQFFYGKSYKSNYINNSNASINNNNSLKDFCKRFSLNINENNTKELDLNDKNIGDIGLEFISQMKIIQLKNLYLDKNELYNIEALAKFKFDKLEILSLKYNNISNIKVLGLVKFNNLLTLSLCENNISDISILEKVNFPELTELNLSTNNILDIKVFEKAKFPKLKKLYLQKNKISDIKSLGKADFKELTELLLFENNISDINVLNNVNFPNLKELSLGHNKISDINILAEVNFEKLQTLFLYENNISDITVLKSVKLENLKKLILTGNKIDKNTKTNYSIISEIKSRKNLKNFEC